MSQYTLIEQLKSNHQICYQVLIYSDPSFLSHNNAFEQHHFYWVDESLDKACAHIAFSVENGIAFSPNKLPFGGLEVSSELTKDDIGDFLKAIEEKCKELTIKELIIHQAAFAYTDQTESSAALKAEGYVTTQNRVFHSIQVDEVQLFDKMHRMEQRKLKKAQAAGAEFRVFKKSEQADAFQQLVQFRKMAGKPASMSADDLEKASHENPNVYSVFGLFIEEHMVAGTVAVRVNKESLYHFMPAQMTSFADHQPYKQYSPMVMLVACMYQWCQKEGIKLLDLGTSYVDDKLKDSLVRFKENIGGKACSALSWQKTLS